MKRTGYAVMSMVEMADINTEWARVNNVHLSFAEGMIGMMPVFSTREDAEAYCNGDDFDIKKIEMVKTDEHNAINSDEGSG